MVLSKLQFSLFFSLNQIFSIRTQLVWKSPVSLQSSEVAPSWVLAGCVPRMLCLSPGIATCMAHVLGHSWPLHGEQGILFLRNGLRHIVSSSWLLMVQKPFMVHILPSHTCS